MAPAINDEHGHVVARRLERHDRHDREQHDEVDAADQEELAHLRHRRRAHAAVALHHRARRDGTCGEMKATPVRKVIP